MTEGTKCTRCKCITVRPKEYNGKMYCSFCFGVVSLGIKSRILEKTLSIMFPKRRKKKEVRK